MVEQASQTNPSSFWFSSEDAQFPTPEGVHWRIVTRPMTWRPPTDVYETEDSIVVRTEIAGMREEDFFISLDERLITIKGVRSDTPERRAYHQMEITYGEFIIEVELPYPVDNDKVNAIYRDGFLRITLPKAPTHHVKPSA